MRSFVDLNNADSTKSTLKEEFLSQIGTFLAVRRYSARKKSRIDSISLLVLTQPQAVLLLNETYISLHYPDVQVVCESNASTAQFQDQPVLINEVLSPSTRRYDLDEKMTAYLWPVGEM